MHLGGVEVSRIAVVTGVLLGAFALGGCPKKEEAKPADAQLLSEAKLHFAERERRLTSYQLQGQVEEAGKVAAFEFAYRAPNRMKGSVREPDGAERTFSYDGDRLFILAPADKTLTTVELKAARTKGTVLLTQIFGAIAPEGFRAPLLELDHATAKKVSRPNAPEAVELSSTVPDEGGGKIEVAYVYRWPAMDLLEKRLTARGQTMHLTVAEEQCDEKLRLCVPKKLVQKYGDQPGATSTLSKIALNAPVPQDAFTLALPDGFTAKKQELADSAAGQ